MSDLSLTFAETGPIPDPQCALKDAVLLAMQSGETNAETIVANARTFLGFLQNPLPVQTGAAGAAPQGNVPAVNTGAVPVDAPAADAPATVNGFPAA